MKINFMISADFANIFHEFNTNVLVSEDKVTIIFNSTQASFEFYLAFKELDCYIEKEIKIDRVDNKVYLYS